MNPGLWYEKMNQQRKKERKIERNILVFISGIDSFLMLSNIFLESHK